LEIASLQEPPVIAGLPHALPVNRKRNWPKHAAFTVAVVLGLVFCIPPLLRATVGESGDKAATPDDSLPDVLPLDAEFSSTKRLEPSRAPSAASPPSLAHDAVVVMTTILGKTHRAAVVNGRLRREGDRIVIAGESFRLERVFDDRIELRSDASRRASDRLLVVRKTLQHGGTK
jgi:hypothetical protein